MYLEKSKILILLVAVINFSYLSLEAQIAAPSIKKEAEKIDIADFLGSPYHEEKFVKAIIYDGLTSKESTQLVRYDALNDVFEMKSELSQSTPEYLKQSSEITVTIDSKKFYYKSYTNDEGKFVWGYLQEIAKVGNKLFYLKYGKTLIMPQEAKTTLEQDRPGKIKDQEYYVVGAENQLKYTTINKKTILFQIPLDKRDQVKAFIKKEKLKFKSIKDIKKLASFFSKD